MNQKLFMVGVADARIYSDAKHSRLISTAKTLINSSLEITSSSTDINAGKGNKLQYRFFHTALANVTFTDVLFNLNYLNLNLGSTISNGFNTRFEESVTLATYTGTLSKIPVAVNGGSILVYYSYNGTDFTNPVVATINGGVATFEVAASDRALIPQNAKVCATYYVSNNAAKYVEIPAEIIPHITCVELDVNLATSEDGKGVVGRATIIIPAFQFSGAQTLNMTSDGYSQSDLTGSALAYTPVGGSNACANADIYGYVVQELNDAHWYDDVVALVVQNITLAQSSTKVLPIYAFNGVYSFLLTGDALNDLTVTPASSELTWSAADGTIAASGSATSSSVTVSITLKPLVTDTATVTIA